MCQEVVRQHGRVGLDFDEFDRDRRYLANHDAPQSIGDGSICAGQHELRREFRAGTHRDNRMPLHGWLVLWRPNVLPSNRICFVYGPLHVAPTVLIPFKQTVIKGCNLWFSRFFVSLRSTALAYLCRARWQRLFSLQGKLYFCEDRTHQHVLVLFVLKERAL